MIRMVHGSGGLETLNLIESVFLKHLQNPALSRLEDAAVLEVSGKVAFSTDSFVVDPLFFPGGDIGLLAVCGTVNDLWMMGATPRALTAGFILEEGLPIATLEKVVASMAHAAREAEVEIVAGDTKVVPGHGGLYINTAGIGVIPQGLRVAADQCRPGDALVLSGRLGDHHASILSARMHIENQIVSDVRSLGAQVGALLQSGVRVRAMRDVTRGGLATIVGELCQASGCGARLIEDRLPVAPATDAFCRILGLDPLYMGNEGQFVAVVDAADAVAARDALRHTPGGEEAEVIGEITSGSRVTLQTALGGERVLGPLVGEGLPRIC